MLPYGETITVLRGVVGTDRYGNEIVDWNNPTRFTVDNCAIAPRHLAGFMGEVKDEGRQGVIVGYNVYAPPGTVIRPTDRVRYRGEDFEVEGEPAQHHHPLTGWEPMVEFAMRRVEG